MEKERIYERGKLFLILLQHTNKATPLQDLAEQTKYGAGWKEKKEETKCQEKTYKKPPPLLGGWSLATLISAINCF